jgi:predicted AlkP superfamily pyrophosphatase or phosphodiesterase
MVKRPSTFVFLALLASLAVQQPAQAAGPDDKPRLVVLISIDQFRADYLTRFEDLFLAPTVGSRFGGFRYLMDRGAYYPDAHHDHLPLATGPGHSIHFTGAPPYKSGIVANDWYDRELKKSVYCVEDADSPLVGATGRGVSPDHLRVTTVGDELKMATGGRAKVFGIALKDRAAVLMAGHLADGVFWYDDRSGNWISSRYYRKDGTLPQWLVDLNNQGVPRKPNQVWPLHEAVKQQHLDRLWMPPGHTRESYAKEYYDNRNGLGLVFPHSIPEGDNVRNGRYQPITVTPLANSFVFESALTLIRSENLGKDDIPDVLAINLSSNDYIGHSYGPDSPEVLDVTVRTDRYLSDFLNELTKIVPGGLANVTFVITADHGAPPIGKAMRDSGIRGGVWSGKVAATIAEEAITARFGKPAAAGATWVNHYDEPYLWLNRDVLADNKVSLGDAQRIAGQAIVEKMQAIYKPKPNRVEQAIYAAYAGQDILAGLLPRTDIAKHVTLGYHPLVSGDVAIISLPFYMPRDILTGETHAEPYAYDTRVPLIVSGYGVRPGTYTERVSTLDIAPTLSFLLHVQQPSGCEGKILSRGLKEDGPKK